MLIKIVAIVAFLAIIVSLGSALFHLVKPKDDAQPAKTAKALTYRIGLSLLLFILLFIAYATGLLQPQGIGARIQQSHAEKAANSNP
ncbi:MAG: twin transmembrane helix small protein [Methylomonas sp.]